MQLLSATNAKTLSRTRLEGCFLDARGEAAQSIDSRLFLLCVNCPSSQTLHPVQTPSDGRLWALLGLRRWVSPSVLTACSPAGPKNTSIGF